MTLWKGCYVAVLCPSQSQLYESFSIGISTHIGDVVLLDKASTIEVLKKLLELYKDD